jgi:hypothetical protein
MVRRWIIRSFAILLVVACSVMWVRSYSFITGGYAQSGRYAVNIGASRGRLFVGWVENGGGMDGFHYSNHARSGLDYLPDHDFLGFSVQTYRFNARFFRSCGIPFWFVIVIFSTVLFFVWRKTRKVNPATAFPVVTTKVTQ